MWFPGGRGLVMTVPDSISERLATMIIIIDLLKYISLLQKNRILVIFILQNYIHTIPFSIFLGAT